MADDRLVMYSDYVCPFCYLGYIALNTYRADRDDPPVVEWHPYDLRGHKRRDDGSIDPSIDDGKDDAYFARVGENVERLKDAYGAREMLGIEDRPRDVDSYNAQLVSLAVLADAPERWPALDAAIFEALWLDGRDIGDRVVLCELAEAVGIDPDVVRGALGSQRASSTLRERFADAHRAGVTAVPTFVFGGRAVRGAVPPDRIAQLIEAK